MACGSDDRSGLTFPALIQRPSIFSRPDTLYSDMWGVPVPVALCAMRVRLLDEQVADIPKHDGVSLGL